MDIGLDKCATLSMNGGKLCHSNGIKLHNSSTMKGLGLGDSYKYLSILKVNDIKHAQIKKKTTAEYLLWQTQEGNRSIHTCSSLTEASRF